MFCLLSQLFFLLEERIRNTLFWGDVNYKMIVIMKWSDYLYCTFLWKQHSHFGYMYFKSQCDLCLSKVCTNETSSNIQKTTTSVCKSNSLYTTFNIFLHHIYYVDPVTAFSTTFGWGYLLESRFIHNDRNCLKVCLPRTCVKYLKLNCACFCAKF